MKLCKISTTGVVARAVLPLFLLCEATTPAHSADWRFTAIRSTHYGTSLAFIDVSSVRGGNGRVSFWASTYFSRSTRGMNRVSALVTANCSTLTYRFDQIVLFYNQRPLGRWASRASARAVPRTNVYDEINSACGARDFGTHIGIPEAFAASYFAGRQRRA
jgi:hypothetical protein